jgi:hypothetical protein
MARYQVLCINKDDRYNPYERIQFIGGKFPDGNRWKISQADAINHIRNQEHSFFVSVSGVEAEVEVAISPYVHYYIKTKPDGNEPNNLLSLEECPS